MCKHERRGHMHAFDWVRIYDHGFGYDPRVTRVLFAGLVGLHVVRHMLLVVVTRGQVETYNASASVMSV